MAEMTPEQRKKGLAYADLVRKLAETAPDEGSARLMNKAASRLQVYYGMSRAKKKLLIVRMVAAVGGMSVQEISDRTFWRYRLVQELLSELADEGRIDAQTVPPVGRGRSSLLITIPER